MGLREMLAGVADNGYQPRLGPTQDAQAHLRSVREDIARILPPIGLRVRVSGAAVNLPKIAWIAILDPDVTKTAQSGLYVVYLYAADLSHVSLTMNQGATAHRDHASQHRQPGVTIGEAAVAELTAESTAIRAQLPESLVDAYPREIDLGSDEFLPTAYEAGSVAAITYSLDSLPNETELRGDLKRFLKIYDASVEARKALTAANPGLFHTPAIATPPEADSGSELFKPKDASDYVATVAAQKQVRKRRHEAVLKSFGEHAMACGWEPSTKVHPRDLTLTRNGADILCEVKVVRANAEGAVREAIGQLFAYRHFLYPDQAPNHLLAVFSDEVGGAFVDLLSTLGIESAWPTERSAWTGSDGLAELGLVAGHVA